MSCKLCGSFHAPDLDAEGFCDGCGANHPHGSLRVCVECDQLPWNCSCEEGPVFVPRFVSNQEKETR